MKNKYLDTFVNTLKERYEIVNFEEIVNCCWYHSYVFISLLDISDEEEDEIKHKFNRMAQFYAFSKFEHTNFKFYDFLDKFISLMGTIAENYNERMGCDVFSVGLCELKEDYVDWLLREVF